LPSVFEGGLAFTPGGIAYGTNGGTISAAQLFTINLTTGAATVIGTISGGAHDINGLVYRADGNLIGLDAVTNSLLVINPTTANATILAPAVGGSIVVGGMMILNGVGHYIEGAGGPNRLYSFNLTTGSGSFIGSFGVGGTGISGLAATPVTAVPEP